MITLRDRLRATSAQDRVDPAGIPRALKDLPQWVGWRWDERTDGSWTKVPINPHTGRNASTDRSETWATFDTAMTMVQRRRADGIGFVLTTDDPFVGIDLDDVLDPDGQIEPHAADLVRRLNTYTEYSPSGRGLHLFAIGTLALPDGRTGRRTGKYELYQAGRFFTVTGKLLQGCPSDPQARQAGLTDLYRQLFGDENQPRRIAPSQGSIGHRLSDAEVVSLAARAANGAKYSALFGGDTSAYDGDESRADQALCTLLSFWTQDPAQIERIFTRSALGQRDKWQRRADYRERTIRTALERAEVYEAHRRPSGLRRLRVHRPQSLRVREVGHA